MNIGQTVPFITDINSQLTASVQQEHIGTLGYDRVGRAYRYVLAGAVDLVTGNLLQSPARDTAFTDMAVAAAAAVGATTVTVTLGGTATVANQFVGGTLSVTVTPGIGQCFVIKAHTVTAASGTCTVTLEEPIVTALTTSSKVTMNANIYRGVIQSPTTRTGKTVGVAQVVIPAANFGWIGAQGVFAVLSDATVAAVGEGLSPSTSTAGAVTKQVTLLENIGTAHVLGVSAKCEPAFITIC